MQKLFLPLLLLCAVTVLAQPRLLTVANAHSHNDYEQPVPFYTAWHAGFGSIEADIFLKDGQLLVAHEEKYLDPQKTLETLYLQPLQGCIKKNKGYVYADSSRRLLLLVDIKTDSINTLNTLVELLKNYPDLVACRTLKFTITGNRPSPQLFTGYPAFINFDGELNKNYSAAELSRIILLSDNLRSYTNWNGKGIVPEREAAALNAAVKKAHNAGKPVRFWGAPDYINAWYRLMHAGVDYLNTDHIPELASFLNKLPATTYIPGNNFYKTYQPTYKNDGQNKQVKNIILFIGDGTSYPQLYAGYTANKGALNIFNMRRTGTSKTSSHDSYVTDSAPGSTAISSGEKTNNRFVGVDHTGKALPLLPLYFSRRKMKTGLVTCGDIADATPADFYAHQSEREHAADILNDLNNAPVDLLMGSGDESLQNVAILDKSEKTKISDSVLQQLGKKYSIVSSLNNIPPGNNKVIVVDKQAGLSMRNGRGNWLQEAVEQSIDRLSKNKEGFFLMAEGAQIDYGGHDNNLPYVVTEVMDFDQAVGKALEFADKDGETLVIVTADHETGGLTLLDGDYNTGYVSGQFATNDHTALPVPVFAYGPQSQLFSGVYENTELFFKILQAAGISVK
ncbi:alkaline phosphatase [Foetidibacter luteolus]|uniref:alkaline phosphatase n=1 Tax=Foetidibacter luteolus TaxID=2608880 RepID=UPI001A98676A|nr:alkaline phosphatase [Foetidibacter luteolus]